jgi:hypothetical protein
MSWNVPNTVEVSRRWRMAIGIVQCKGQLVGETELTTVRRPPYCWIGEPASFPIPLGFLKPVQLNAIPLRGGEIPELGCGEKAFPQP